MRLTRIVALAAAGTLLVGCSNGTSTTTSQQPGSSDQGSASSETATGGGSQIAEGTPIKIGFFSPVTGPTASDGKNSRAGAELAVDQLNANGGVAGHQIDLISYDDQGSAAQGTAVARKLVQQDEVTVGISGAYSDVGAAAAQVFQDASVPMISAYGVSAAVTAPGNFIFRTGSLGEVEGYAAAKFAKDDLKIGSVAILECDADPCADVASATSTRMGEQGITVTADEKFALSETSFGSIIDRVLEGNPDMVVIDGYYDAVAQIIPALREKSQTVKIMIATLSDSTSLIDLAGADTVEGVYLTSPFARSDVGDVNDFIKAFKDKTGHAPDEVAATSYDAVIIAAASLTATNGVGGAALRDAIAGLQDVQGMVCTPLQSITDQSIVRDMGIVQIRDGDFAPVTTIPFPKS